VLEGVASLLDAFVGGRPEARLADSRGVESAGQPAPDRRGVTMRKLIVSNLISLDGYASGPRR